MNYATVFKIPTHIKIIPFPGVSFTALDKNVFGTTKNLPLKQRKVFVSLLMAASLGLEPRY